MAKGKSVTDGIPTRDEIDSAIQEAKDQLKADLKEVMSKAAQEAYGSVEHDMIIKVNGLINQHFDLILERKLSHLTNQILVGAHVSQIIKLVKES